LSYFRWLIGLRNSFEPELLIPVRLMIIGMFANFKAQLSEGFKSALSRIKNRNKKEGVSNDKEENKV